MSLNLETEYGWVQKSSCIWVGRVSFIFKNWFLLICITDSMDVSLSELLELVMDREAWRAVIHGVTKSRTRLSNWTELNVLYGSWGRNSLYTVKWFFRRLHLPAWNTMLTLFSIDPDLDLGWHTNAGRTGWELNVPLCSLSLFSDYWFPDSWHKVLFYCLLYNFSKCFVLCVS